jgi:hypothetical protein
MAATEGARQERVDGAGPPYGGHLLRQGQRESRVATRLRSTASFTLPLQPSPRCSRSHSGATLSTRERIIGENDLLRFANRND